LQKSPVKRYSAKETYNLIDLTDSSHPISVFHMHYDIWDVTRVISIYVSYALLCIRDTTAVMLEYICLECTFTYMKSLESCIIYYLYYVLVHTWCDILVIHPSHPMISMHFYIHCHIHEMRFYIHEVTRVLHYWPPIFHMHNYIRDMTRLLHYHVCLVLVHTWCDILVVHQSHSMVYMHVYIRDVTRVMHYWRFVVHMHYYIRDVTRVLHCIRDVTRVRDVFDMHYCIRDVTRVVRSWLVWYAWLHTWRD